LPQNVEDEAKSQQTSLDLFCDVGLGKIVLVLIDGRHPNLDLNVSFTNISDTSTDKPKLTALQITDQRQNLEWQYLNCLAFLFFVAHQIVVSPKLFVHFCRFIIVGFIR
jgi:hypothetical protein